MSKMRMIIGVMVKQGKVGEIGTLSPTLHEAVKKFLAANEYFDSWEHAKDEGCKAVRVEVVETHEIIY